MHERDTITVHKLTSLPATRIASGKSKYTRTFDIIDFFANWQNSLTGK